MKRLLVVLLLVSACSSHRASPPAAGPSASPTPTPSATATAVATATAATGKPVDAGPAGGPVPAGLKPVSVTFVSTQTGWVLGDATCSAPPCTSIARTRDGGRTWRGIPAPAAAINGEGGPSVNQLRFGDLLNGFAFGDSLFTTHDGGRHWKLQPVTGGVVSVEVGQGRYWVVATGCGQAADTCTKPGRVLTGRVGSDVMTTVRDLPPMVTGQVVLHGAAAFLALYRQNDQSAAPALVESSTGGSTFGTRAMPCGDAEIPFLAAASDTHLSLVCQSLDAGAGQQGKRYFTSVSSGQAWAAHAAPAQIVGTAVAATGNAAFVGNSRTGVEVTRDGGATWTSSLQTDAGASYLGFASATFGEVITGEGLQLTRDAGRTWQRVAF